MAVVGALCASGEMELSLEDMQNALKQRMKPELLEMNIKALQMGADCIK